MMHKTLKSLALGLVMMTAGSAMAQVPADTLRVVEYVPASHAFGRQGQVILGGTSSLDLSGVYGSKQNQVFGPVFTLNPEASVFVAPHFAVGLRTSFQALRTNTSKEQSLKDTNIAWAIGVGPQLTASVPMSDRMSFLPSVAPMYGYTKGSHRAVMNVDLNFGVHAADHLVVTFGPYVSQDMYSNDKDEGRDTVFGLKAGVLGWM